LESPLFSVLTIYSVLTITLINLTININDLAYLVF
jgi:hypothetical protein